VNVVAGRGAAIDDVDELASGWTIAFSSEVDAGSRQENASK